MGLAMSLFNEEPTGDEAQQRERKPGLRPGLFLPVDSKDRKKRRPGLCEDIENMILEYGGIESVVALSLLSSAAYAFILTRKAEYSSLFSRLIQTHVRLKRSGRALTVEAASFSERPFKVIKWLLSPEMRLLHSLEGHRSMVTAISHSPDGRCFVTGADDGSCTMWTQGDKGQWQSSPLLIEDARRGSSYDREVSIISFSPDGRYFVTGCAETCHAWTQDDEGQWQSSKTLRVHFRIMGIRYTQYECVFGVVLGNWPCTYFCQDEGGKWGRIIFREEQVLYFTGSTCYSPDPAGRYIVSGFGGSAERSLCVWSLDANDQYQKTDLPRRHTGSITLIGFSPDGGHFVAGSTDGTCIVWTRDTNDQWLSSRPLIGGAAETRIICHSPDGRCFVTWSRQCFGQDRKYSLLVWSQDDDGQWQSSPPLENGPWVEAICFSPDGSCFVTRDYYGCAVWAQDVNGQWKSSALRIHDSFVRGGVSFSPDGRCLVTSSENGHCQVWTRGGDGIWLDEQCVFGTKTELPIGEREKHTAEGSGEGVREDDTTDPELRRCVIA